MAGWPSSSTRTGLTAVRAAAGGAAPSETEAIVAANPTAHTTAPALRSNVPADRPVTGLFLIGYSPFQ